MEDGGGVVPAYPQVFVVDSQAACVAEPVGGYPRARGGGWRHRLLFALVLLALLGVLIEACCIYNLHKNHEEESSSTPKREEQRQEASNEILLPVTSKPKRKPAALLIGKAVTEAERSQEKKDVVLQWTDGGDGFLQGMDYKGGSLTVKQEGFYFLYSKVALSVSQCSHIRHAVVRRSPRYGNGNKSMDLMQSLKYHCPKQRDKQEHTSDLSNSYLGGAFLLFANDTIYVTLTRQTRTGHNDNFFGAFML